MRIHKFDLIRERLIQFIRYNCQGVSISIEYPLNYQESSVREYRLGNGLYKGLYYADVLSVGRDSYLNEYEIKTSYGDFQREFTHKFEKHEKIMKGEGPNRFFFVAPNYSDLAPRILDVVKEKKMKNYGVISVGDEDSLVLRSARIFHKRRTDLVLGEGRSLASVAREAIKLENQLFDVRNRDLRRESEKRKNKNN